MQSRHRIGETMKALRSLQILLIAGTLAMAASASDDVSSPAQRAGQAPCARTHAGGADATCDDSGSQATSDLDRRDRIFYPGETIRGRSEKRQQAGRGLSAHAEGTGTWTKFIYYVVGKGEVMGQHKPMAVMRSFYRCSRAS